MGGKERIRVMIRVEWTQRYKAVDDLAWWTPVSSTTDMYAHAPAMPCQRVSHDFLHVCSASRGNIVDISIIVA